MSWLVDIFLKTQRFLEFEDWLKGALTGLVDDLLSYWTQLELSEVELVQALLSHVICRVYNGLKLKCLFLFI